MPFGSQMIRICVTLIAAGFTTKVLLIVSESRILRKLRKRREVSIACGGSSRGQSSAYPSKDTVSQAELHTEQRAFCKAYCELSKGAHSLLGISYGPLYMIWLLSFDMLFTASSTVPGLGQLDVTLGTYEPLVALRLLLSLTTLGVLGVWPANAKRSLPSSAFGEKRMMVLFLLALFAIVVVYVFSIFAFATKIFFFTLTTRRWIAGFRAVMLVYLISALVFQRVLGGRYIASVARTMLANGGTIPEDSVHDRVYKEVRKGCCHSPPLWYSPSKIDRLGIVFSAVLFSTNAMTWGSYLDDSLKLNCEFLAVDLVLEALVCFMSTKRSLLFRLSHAESKGKLRLGDLQQMSKRN